MNRLKKLYLFSTTKKTYAVENMESCEKFFESSKERPQFTSSIMMNPAKLKKIDKGIYEISALDLGLKN